MYKVVGGSVLLVLLVLIFAAARTNAEPQMSGSSTGHGDAHYHKNLVGVFTGVTHGGRRKNAGALGFEYERRLSERFGLGVTAEYTFGDADVWVAVVPFAYHAGQWKLYVAPGVEDGHHGTEELLRLGAEYAFEFADGWEIAPQINVDLVDKEDVWVFGVVFAKGF
jgi:hypothetical protein